jgi:hypothetical protein
MTCDIDNNWDDTFPPLNLINYNVCWQWIEEWTHNDRDEKRDTACTETHCAG